jgi:hypothetical protein
MMEKGLKKFVVDGFDITVIRLKIEQFYIEKEIVPIVN